MKTQDGRNEVGLTVANFGPILEADISLRPMTVFVGPSNTGKSYMAMLIYALHQFFSSYAGTDRVARLRRGLVMESMLISGQEQPALSEANIQFFFDWIWNSLKENKQTDEFEGASSELPETIADLIRPVLDNIGEFDEILSNEIVRCFGVEGIDNLLNYRSSDLTEFALRGTCDRGNGTRSKLGYDFSATSEGVTINAEISKDLPLRYDSKFGLWRRQFDTGIFDIDELPEDDQLDFKKYVARNAVEDIFRGILNDIVGPLTHRAHYLPADRAGVMHAHQVVVRALIASASRAALRSNLAMPALSGVLGDFLEQLVELAGGQAELPHSFRRYRPMSELEGELASDLEDNILGGTVRVVTTEINYPSFVYRPADWDRDLPLMNASSMVSELAPVAFYLRNVVRPGELLIVEEPESHLHPAMQVEFIRFLARTVRSGVRIIITTHSEWVLEELANLVRLSDLPDDQRGNLAAADFALSEEQVGAWSFNPGVDGKGSVVSEIPLDIDLGGFPSGFGLITEELYNRWAVISNRIREN